jgi:cytidylate kinase
MGILFLRQISILKQPAKINYAPLMIGIGAISSVVHFITHPEYQDIVLLLRESSFTFLASLILYIIMNIMHQTVESEQKKVQHEFTLGLIEQITQLKKYTSELEEKMTQSQLSDVAAREEVRTKFKEDIKALDTIKSNQNRFLDMFDEMKLLNKGVEKAFKDFTDNQMPSLDKLLHKHIEMARISEQDHYNKLKALLQDVTQNKVDLSAELEDIRLGMLKVQNISKSISDSIVSNTISKIAVIAKAYEEQLKQLKSHTESLDTMLYESENKISNIAKNSEMLLTQMSLSTNKMSDIQEQSSRINEIYLKVKSLIDDIESTKEEYKKAQTQLSLLSHELRQSQDEDIQNIKEQIEALIKELTGKIDGSLEKLHKHYHIANEDLSQSVQMLTKKAQMLKGYGDS